MGLQELIDCVETGELDAVEKRVYEACQKLMELPKLPEEGVEGNAAAALGAKLLRKYGSLSQIKLALERRLRNAQKEAAQRKYQMEDMERSILLDPEVKKGKNAEERKALAAKSLKEAKTTVEVDGEPVDRLLVDVAAEADRAVTSLKNIRALLDIAEDRFKRAKELAAQHIDVAKLAVGFAG